MTAKELKETLVNVPDDAEVFIDNYFTFTKISNNIEYDEYNNRFIMAPL